MSIQSEITRISGNVSSALTAIAAKGVTVPSGSNSDDLATLITAIPSGGGGGLTSVVRGSFKYTAEGWNTISLPYTGNGYPIAAIVFPKGGFRAQELVSANRRYTVVVFEVYKDDATIRPVYDGTVANTGHGYVKSSSSDATSITTFTSFTNSVYNNNEPTNSNVYYVFRISGDKEIKVRMVDTTHNTTRYGFLVNIDYEYLVVYSS